MEMGAMAVRSTATGSWRRGGHIVLGDHSPTRQGPHLERARCPRRGRGTTPTQWTAAGARIARVARLRPSITLSRVVTRMGQDLSRTDVRLGSFCFSGLDGRMDDGVAEVDERGTIAPPASRIHPEDQHSTCPTTRDHPVRTVPGSSPAGGGEPACQK